jgi:hypothetical protein
MPFLEKELWALLEWRKKKKVVLIFVERSLKIRCNFRPWCKRWCKAMRSNRQIDLWIPVTLLIGAGAGPGENIALFLGRLRGTVHLPGQSYGFLRASGDIGQWRLIVARSTFHEASSRPMRVSWNYWGKQVGDKLSGLQQKKDLWSTKWFKRTHWNVP